MSVATEEEEAAALREKVDPNIRMKSKAAELDDGNTAAFSDITPDDLVKVEVTALSNAAAAEF